MEISCDQPRDRHGMKKGRRDGGRTTEKQGMAYGEGVLRVGAVSQRVFLEERDDRALSISI